MKTIYKHLTTKGGKHQIKVFYDSESNKYYAEESTNDYIDGEVVGYDKPMIDLWINNRIKWSREYDNINYIDITNS